MLGREIEMPSALELSLVFQCNLFKVLPNTNKAAAQCMVCKKNGDVKYCKGKTTCNYKLHLKVNKLDFT